MPFGLGNGRALTVVYVPIEPQAILKLHEDKQISIPRLVRYYRCYPRCCFYWYGIIVFVGWLQTVSEKLALFWR